ncbi:MAG: hypothetical protein FE78DRAFT_154067 [Acidomyces sp. 'richmondensis']|nr:MAG: hypothetical protein FE78DRAFT_154067 [Acidomyces sp. 'richmondensis']
MAASFLATHGIDLDAELARLQASSPSPECTATRLSHLDAILNVSLPSTPPGSTWDIHLSPISPSIPVRIISSIVPHHHQPHPDPRNTLNAHTALLTPSLTHPHLHLDKPYLLPSPTHPPPRLGTLAEALSLTAGAKARYTRPDLLARGRRLLEESVRAGVSHVRAFVEVDAQVGTLCLETGIELKIFALERWGLRVQLCAFAQEPLFSPSEGDSDGTVVRGLLEAAAGRAEVDVVGSTPYVEVDGERGRRNVAWVVELSAREGVGVDFHLDYHLDGDKEAMVWAVVEEVKAKDWDRKVRESRPNWPTIMLGHCTALSLFSPDSLRSLCDAIGDLPITFVGLPTSDTYTLGRTLDIPSMGRKYGLHGCVGMNNVGNAFTPQGCCDPMLLAWWGVGGYQVKDVKGVEGLFGCVSVEGRKGMGFERVAGADTGGSERESNREALEVRVGDMADFVVFGADTPLDIGVKEGDEEMEWRVRRRVEEVVWFYDQGRGRRGILGGRLVGG